MSLTEYKEKRSFKNTPEPEGGKGTGKELRFVIQKHDATHLHYDFRLEMEGVLKSWAIPKGPSTDPEIKRLAMMVEDHPYDYRNFEGIIPEEQYGGGTVIIWDEGTYMPLEADSDDLQKQEKQLLDQLKAGKLKILLKGKKLKGAYALVKAYGRGDNGWLLMKLKDKYAEDSDILLKDKSVVSRKTIAQMEKKRDHKPNQKAEKAIRVLEKKGKAAAPVGNRPKDLLKKAIKKPFYDQVKPMLATLVAEPFDEPGWVYEIKWDGYRAVAFMNNGKVAFKSRNDQSYNQKYYPIYEKLKELKINAIIDGEIVVVNQKGNANFGALQNWNSEADGELLYYVFDILWYNGYDLSHLPLLDRKAILAELIPNQSPILLSKAFETSGIDFLNATKRLGLEGIMAKRANSIYQSGNRTNNWLKIKAGNGQEVVIGGFTKISGSPKPFSSLLVGLFKKGKFIYTGKIGTGFSLDTQKELLAQFEPLIISKSPFYEEPEVNKPNRFRFNPPPAKAIWLKPELICEVNFTEMTTDGLMRHPSFKGMREDKKAKEVVLERAVETDEIVPKSINPKDMLVKKEEETQVKKINGHELTFTNTDKIYWPVEKISKGDLINYYDQISAFILPYLKDRPQSLNRYPNGITGQNFYQKDVTGKVPDWIKTYLYHAEGDDTDKHFLVGKDKATLLYMANLGCIEIHPWSSTIKKPDHPTWCILDLDPDKQPFDQTIEVAQVTKAILDDMGVPGYCKTSGSTGLHIYIPLGNKYTYDQSKEFAKIIVTLVNRELPKTTSMERVVADRKGKIYLDFLQNRDQATIAAPYSIRPKPGATVSMPLHWDEVKKGLKMKDFTIYNAVSRANEMGDLFKPVLGKGITRAAVIKRNR